jgi:hypothetical protein
MSTSLTVFLAICILGCDFMIYVLFHWLFGEKRPKHHSFRKRATPPQTPLYYFPAKGSSPRNTGSRQSSMRGPRLVTTARS